MYLLVVDGGVDLPPHERPHRLPKLTKLLCVQLLLHPFYQHLQCEWKGSGECSNRSPFLAKNDETAGADLQWRIRKQKQQTISE